MTTATASVPSHKPITVDHDTASMFVSSSAAGGVLGALILWTLWPLGASLVAAGSVLAFLFAFKLDASAKAARERQAVPTLHQVLAHADERGYNDVVLLPGERPVFYRPDGTRAPESWTLRTHEGFIESEIPYFHEVDAMELMRMAQRSEVRELKAGTHGDRPYRVVAAEGAGGVRIVLD